MAEIFMSTGVAAAIINIALGFGLTVKTAAVTALIVIAVAIYGLPTLVCLGFGIISANGILSLYIHHYMV
ncbi:MAG: hypothetical protein WAO56_01275 [Miniphocaeibacter sp.]|uniref:hypothetical protein n=1 Tax=Miniphocaeibacter sp. TaxID=3100973 RepID=UPI003BAF9AD5